MLDLALNQRSLIFDAEDKMDNQDEVWKKIRSVFGFMDNYPKTEPLSEEELLHIVETLKCLKIEQIVVNLSLENMMLKLRKTLCPQFWQYFKTHSQNSEELYDGQQPIVHSIATLAQAVKQLHDGVAELIPYIERCQKVCDSTIINYDGKLKSNESLLNHLKLHLRATLYSQMPSCASQLVKEVYSAAFRLFCHAKNHLCDEHEDKEMKTVCRGCLISIEGCQCKLISQAFSMINGILQELELIERLAGNIIQELLLSAIDDHVTLVCKDSFDKHRIRSLEEWVDKISVDWIDFVYSANKSNNSSPDDSANRTSNARIQMYRSAMYHKYTSTRIKQLFNIVIEYPESQPALEDLRECLEKTDLRDTLVKFLSQAIQTRLLHPGVTTEDILHAYIAAIKGLRVLDPKGILLELVSEPIRAYLRGRNDFVRYIAISLTDYSCSELSDEMVVAAPLVLDDSYSEVEDMTHWDSWTPDPTHAQSTIKSKSQRTADVVSLLVNIYGSKTVFITEYGTILADRLISQHYDIQREIMYLEQLKVRFGDTLSPLHKCEVMVKDVADSKRINASIQSDQNPHNSRHKFPVSAMILSSQFWPTFKDQSLKVPDEVIREMEIYTESYQDLKGNRTLNWKPHLGQVELEIVLKNRTLNLTVTPTKATIIHHFEKTPKWALDDLSKVTLIPKGILRQKIAFWQAQGLVQELEQDVFVLVEDEEVFESRNSYMGGASSNGGSQEVPLSGASLMEDEAESVMASAQDQRQEELQVLWSYIVGMLTNLNSLPLERIHAMLKMFIQDTVECSLEELRTFLDGKIRQHQITLTNGMYRLMKN